MWIFVQIARMPVVEYHGDLAYKHDDFHKSVVGKKAIILAFLKVRRRSLYLRSMACEDELVAFEVGLLVMAVGTLHLCCVGRYIGLQSIEGVI